MKSSFLIFLILFFTSTATIGQNKLVLKHGLKRRTIKEGKLISLTTKSDTTKVSWKYYCSRDSASSIRIWTVDKIYKDSLSLKQTVNSDSAYKYDTLPYKEYNHQMVHLEKDDWTYHESYGDTKNYKNVNVIIKKPILYNRVTLRYNEINSLLFARASKCDSPGMLLLTGPLVVIGSTIASLDGGKFNTSTFVIGNAAGIAIILATIDFINAHKVKEYKLNYWRIKTK